MRRFDVKCLLRISKALRGYEFDTKLDLFLKHAIVDVAFVIIVMHYHGMLGVDRIPSTICQLLLQHFMV